jgi:hypothetical protein
LGGGEGDDTVIFDALDAFVDLIPGAARWGLAPKVMTGIYRNHGVHTG